MVVLLSVIEVDLKREFSRRQQGFEAAVDAAEPGQAARPAVKEGEVAPGRIVAEVAGAGP